MRISLNLIDTKYNGIVIYKGPSMLDGKPIVAIATGIRIKSANSKTGEFIQVYILSDEGERPTEALNSGKDASVCGNCIHRKKNGWGTCYVNLGQGPNAVYDGYVRGIYPKFTPDMLDEHFSGRIIRFGAYGDPASVPISVWRMLGGVAEGWTGYTHQWKNCDPDLKEFCMASVDTPLQQRQARAKGWKTFRVRNDDEPLQPHEFVCPASKEADKKKTCETCLACHGGEWNGKQVTPVIIVHGTIYKPRRFRAMQRLLRNKKKSRTLHASVALGTRG
jgi:hypothetical protein